MALFSFYNWSSEVDAVCLTRKTDAIKITKDIGLYDSTELQSVAKLIPRECSGKYHDKILSLFDFLGENAKKHQLLSGVYENIVKDIERENHNHLTELCYAYNLFLTSKSIIDKNVKKCHIIQPPERRINGTQNISVNRVPASEEMINASIPPPTPISDGTKEQEIDLGWISGFVFIIFDGKSDEFKIEDSNLKLDTQSGINNKFIKIYFSQNGNKIKSNIVIPVIPNTYIQTNKPVNIRPRAAGWEGIIGTTKTTDKYLLKEIIALHYGSDDTYQVWARIAKRIR